MDRRIGNNFKSPLWTGPEDNAIMIRNRNLNNSKPLPPISYTRHKDTVDRSKQEVEINSALSQHIHVPRVDRKWALSSHKPCILPPIPRKMQNVENTQTQNPQNEENGLHHRHVGNDTRKKMALITEKMQHLNHIQAHKDLTDKTCVTPAINIRQVIPNLEALNFDSDLKYPDKSSPTSVETLPVPEKTLEIVRNDAINKFLASKSCRRRVAICKVIDQELKDGLAEYYRRLSINALISVFPDMSIVLENMELEAKSTEFTPF